MASTTAIFVLFGGALFFVPLEEEEEGEEAAREEFDIGLESMRFDIP